MLLRIAGRLLALGLVAALSQPQAFAQENRQSERKVINKIAPAYPDLARRLSIHGSVKVGIVIAPNGSVKSTRVIGGNPVLVDAAINAVRKWKYEPAADESTELVELKFEPRQ